MQIPPPLLYNIAGHEAPTPAAKHAALALCDPKSEIRNHPQSQMDRLREHFATLFGGEPLLARAPGRVNLIGEHTDYNDGFVMPVAIDLSTWVAAGRRDDRRLLLRSEHMAETLEVHLDAPFQRAHAWTDYPHGVARALQAQGIAVPGANLLIATEVPLGAGLSSSAAIEVATALALLALTAVNLDRSTLARVCQRAENEFVGMRCGIMDQFVSANGRAGHALRLDCRSLEFELVPLPADLALLICNTMVTHALADSAYNQRRAECEDGVRRLAAHLPGVRALRDVTATQLEGHRSQLSETLYRRCRHVVSENERVLAMAAALRNGDRPAMGATMAASHASLHRDYEVSCPELDVLVDAAAHCDGVVGARMTGGGFGGCTVNLVERAAIDSVRGQIIRDYRARTGLTCETYVCEAGDRAEVIPRSR